MDVTITMPETSARALESLLDFVQAYVASGGQRPEIKVLLDNANAQRGPLGVAHQAVLDAL